jgi:hypothetical protein
MPSPEQARWELMNRRQRDGETVQELAAQIEYLAVMAAPEMSEGGREQCLSVPSFIAALADPDLQFELWRRRVNTMAEAVSEALFFLDIYEWKKGAVRRIAPSLVEFRAVRGRDRPRPLNLSHGRAP